MGLFVVSTALMLTCRVRFRQLEQASTLHNILPMLRVACRPPARAAMLPSEPNNYFTNGVLPNGGAQKPSPPSPLLPTQRLPLSELCSRVHERMTAFLTREVQSRRLRSVQEQTKISLRVIQEALRRYKYGSRDKIHEEGVVGR